MNTDKISYFINHPESISAADVSTIQEVKTKFPYCSTLHMLYIKALAVSNSFHFEEELKKSAIHVNDREKLHDLINQTAASNLIPSQVDKVIPESIVKKEIEIETPKPIETVIEEIEVEVKAEPIPVFENIPLEVEKEEKVFIVQEPVEPIIKKEVKATVVEPKKDKVDMAKIIEDIRLKAEAARQKNKPVQPETKVTVETTPIKEVIVEKIIEPEIIPEIIEDNIVEEVIQTVPEEKNIPQEVKASPITEDIVVDKETVQEETIESKPLELDVMAHAMEVAFELDVDNIIKNQIEEEEVKEEIVEEIEIEATEISDPNNLSFTDWLKYKQGKLKVKEEDVSSEKIKLSKTEIDNLLNKFIEEEPKMSRPQKEFYNPVKNAKKSLDDTTVLVSETLAKIYWMQKNYEKAIRAYEQLSLRNPEKKTFFANQIKKIKKEVK